MKKSNAKGLFIVAICFYIASGIMLYKGYDKMVNYYSSEYYSQLNVNAYVGGDAYNYIINGNYATGFYVLSIGFLLSGTVCVTSGVIIKNMPELSTPIAMQQENPEELAEELPEL